MKFINNKAMFVSTVKVIRKLKINSVKLKIISVDHKIESLTL